MAPRRPKTAPRRPKMAPGRPQDGPKTAQDGPKTRPKSLNTFGFPMVFAYFRFSTFIKAQVLGPLRKKNSVHRFSWLVDGFQLQSPKLPQRSQYKNISNRKTSRNGVRPVSPRRGLNPAALPQGGELRAKSNSGTLKSSLPGVPTRRGRDCGSDSQNERFAWTL